MSRSALPKLVLHSTLMYTKFNSAFLAGWVCKTCFLFLGEVLCEHTFDCEDLKLEITKQNIIGIYVFFLTVFLQMLV